MSVLVDSTNQDVLNIPPRKSVSAHRLNYRKQSTDGEVKVKKSSVIRRKKNNLGNQNFRHSVHDISGALNELNIKEEDAGADGVVGGSAKLHTERARLRRTKSFHVSEDHAHQNISQRDRSEILKQYVANKFELDMETLENDLNSDKVPKIDFKESSLPIHEAIMKKYEQDSLKELSFLLLKNDCLNIEQTNADGMTPLAFAVSLELHDVVRLLIAFGATVNCKDNYGEAPLRYAVDNGDFEMASLLISNGANASVVQNGF
eukprot:TCONS_00073143-protein